MPIAPLLVLATSFPPAQGLREPARPAAPLEGLSQAGPLLLQMRVQHIQESMNLPDAQARSLAERWSRYDRDFILKTRELGQIRKRFNDILMGPGSEEEKNNRLRPLMDQFIEGRKQQMELKARFEEEIRTGLSPAQQVRLILLVDELQQRLRDSIREALKDRRPGKF